MPSEILTGPVMLTPTDRASRFEGEVAAERLFSGEIGLPTNLVRPAHLRAPRYGALGLGPAWARSESEASSCGICARQDSNLRPPA